MRKGSAPMSPGMEILLVVWSILATLAVLFLALDGSRKGLAAGLMEAENHDLRTRIAELLSEVRHLRATSGVATDARTQSLDDELMPLRSNNKVAKTGRAIRPGSAGIVGVVSQDGVERQRIADAVAVNGYSVVPVALADTASFVRELTTAALILDLRDTPTATEAPALLESFAQDTLAKDVPVFALIKTASERELLLEDSHYTSSFVAPTDIALFTSTLGAAVIRRRTRARRAEAARNISAFGRN